MVGDFGYFGVGVGVIVGSGAHLPPAGSVPRIKYSGLPK